MVSLCPRSPNSGARRSRGKSPHALLFEGHKVTKAPCDLHRFSEVRGPGPAYFRFFTTVISAEPVVTFRLAPRTGLGRPMRRSTAVV